MGLCHQLLASIIQKKRKKNQGSGAKPRKILPTYKFPDYAGRDKCKSIKWTAFFVKQTTYRSERNEVIVTFPYISVWHELSVSLLLPQLLASLSKSYLPHCYYQTKMSIYSA